MLLIIGTHQHCEALIRDMKLNPLHCRIISRAEQLYGIDRGMPALLAHSDCVDRNYDLMRHLIYEREVVVLN